MWEEIDKSAILIEPLFLQKMEHVLNMAITIFRNHMSEAEIKEYLIAQTDFNLSSIAVYHGEIIGFYLIGDNHVPADLPIDNLLIPENEYKRILALNGMEGVVLGVLPDFRKEGVGKMLISNSYAIAEKFHKDYIWGQHYITFNNLPEWEKMRTHFASDDEVHYTIKIF